MLRDATAVTTTMAAPVPPSVDRHVVLACGGVRYAVPAAGVEQTLPAEEPADGAVTFGGVRYPVLDLRRLFGAPAERSGRLVLVADRGGRRAALLVDAVGDPVVIDAHAVMPLPPRLRGHEQRWFEGVARVDGASLVVLRLEGMLP